LMSSSLGSQTNITAAAGSAAQWCAVRDISFSGSPLATDSLDLGNNSGITITPPGSGGGAVYPRAGLQAIGEGLSR
jgi:hypothetical protein